MNRSIGLSSRSLLAFAHDVTASALAWLAAWWLRFNLDIPAVHWPRLAQVTLLVVAVQAVLFVAFGLYRGIWRYASLSDLKRILATVAVSAATVATLIVMLRFSGFVPRSVLLLYPVLLLGMMTGGRVAYRMWKEHRLYGIAQMDAEPVLVLGAGDAGAELVKDLTRSARWRVVGLLDDSPGKQGRYVCGVKVLGRLEDLPPLAERLGVEHAIIAMPSAHHKTRRRALESCQRAGIKALTVPALEDLVSGRVTVSALREVELDDLLGRDPVVLDDSGLHGLLTGQTVLVSGAGGSIGSELCRQIRRFAPARIVMLEQSEFALYRMEQEFAEAHPECPVVCAVGDVKDEARVDEILARHRPAVVFHAAAYKHVPLMEVENAWQAVRNNVLGTAVLAAAAVRHGAGRFVLVSTDKAVNPTNVMGATKRLAEMVCQALQPGAQTRFVMVRFGNVLGSAGSVIPKFREQIARGGPVTVTHPEVTRYFMSIPEAAQLVLQAGLMGNGGEIFVLDMGEPVRIVDLARDLIRLSGLSQEEVRIEFTGLRPGEKLYEELLADDEHTLPTPHPQLRIARARSADGAWLRELQAWLNGPAPADDDAVRRALSGWVPEYNPGAAEPARRADGEGQVQAMARKAL